MAHSGMHESNPVSLMPTPMPNHAAAVFFKICALSTWPHQFYMLCRLSASNVHKHDTQNQLQGKMCTKNKPNCMSEILVLVNRYFEFL